MPTVHVLFLGPAADLAGFRQCDLTIPDPCSVADLRAALCERFPALVSPIKHMRVAVNQSLTQDHRPVRGDDEVALIPPVSGGSDAPTIWVQLMPDAIPLDRVRTFIGEHPNLGGIVTFDGVTRAETDDEHGDLTRLDYECYDAMALSMLRRLASTARDRFGAERAVILHRTGQVAVGEASVVIAAACAHRAEAFEACRWLIDSLKADVPIWKKEVFTDGFTRWVDPTRSANELRTPNNTPEGR